MIRTLLRQSVLGGVVSSVLVFAAGASAGTPFRLEIGPPIAGATKVKGAAFAVRALACDDPSTVKMTGTAEGFVNGARQSVALKLLTLDTPGVFAVPQDWPSGVWVVNITATCPSRSATASAIVPIVAKGFDRASSKLLDHAATAAEIDSVLKPLAASNRS